MHRAWHVARLARVRVRGSRPGRGGEIWGVRRIRGGGGGRGGAVRGGILCGVLHAGRELAVELAALGDAHAAHLAAAGAEACHACLG